jgi:hypothetical protein
VRGETPIALSSGGQAHGGPVEQPNVSVIKLPSMLKDTKRPSDGEGPAHALLEGVNRFARAKFNALGRREAHGGHNYNANVGHFAQAVGAEVIGWKRPLYVCSMKRGNVLSREPRTQERKCWPRGGGTARGTAVCGPPCAGLTESQLSLYGQRCALTMGTRAAGLAFMLCIRSPCPPRELRSLCRQ